MNLTGNGRKGLAYLAIAAVLAAGMMLPGLSGAAATVTGDLVVQGPWVDPRACNNSLATAVALAQRNGTGIRIWSPVNLTSSISATVPITVEPGGKIVQTGPYSLAIKGPFKAGTSQVFSGFRAGQITFSGASVDGIRPEWGGGTDTQQMQWASDTATSSVNVPIIVGRRMTITSAINIDRVDVTRYFRIIGTGKDAGFYTASPISIFSSSVAHTTGPVIFMVRFENIRFEASSKSLNCFAVNGDKFLLISFTNCFFLQMRVAYTENYFQSWTFDKCYFRVPDGWIMQVKSVPPSSADGLVLDMHVTNCAFEGGDSSSRGFLKTDNATVGCSFIGNLFEPAYGVFYDVPSTVGGVISGNYFEACLNASTGHGGPVIKLGQGTTISITGNQFNLSKSGTGRTAHADSWAVAISLSSLPNSGKDFKIFSAGNSSKGNYCDNSGLAAYTFVKPTITSQGDGLWNQYANAVLFKDGLEVNQGTPRSGKVTLANGAATSVPVGVCGTVLLGSQWSSVYGTFAFRANRSNHLVDMGTRGGHVNITTGALTGTTGTNGKFTVSAGTDGRIYFENRIGASTTFTYTIDGY